MAREALNVHDDMLSVIMQMGEGNPGAIRVLMELMKADQIDGFMRLLDLDDMNIRGSQVWLGYKDHCGEDMDTFMAAVRDRDKDMVSTINAQRWPKDTAEVAVANGASFAKREDEYRRR